MSASETLCVLCGSANLDRRPAVISAFISEYALQKPPGISAILECLDCTMLFYELRPTDQDMAKLYTGYRGEAYFKTRSKHEFWYTRRFNESLGSEKHMPVRRRVFLDSLARHRDLSTFANVLDYGGDRGQMLTEGPGKNRFVFEMSNAVPEPHIANITRKENLVPAGYDLILLCHVLEHLSRPADMLTELKALLAPGGLLFIELPLDHFRITNIPKRNWYKKYLSFLICHPLLFQLMSFYSLALRPHLSAVPPLGFAPAHEHINMFTPNALRMCLLKGGYNVQEIFEDPRTGNLYAIAQPSN